jgi:hypothetical protein
MVNNSEWLNLITEIASIVGAGFTIIGVVFAIIIYFLWKRDYVAQKADEYALGILTKLKHLHFEIEQLRAPKAYNKKTIEKDIINEIIPQMDKLYKKAIMIKPDLLNAKNILLKNKNLLGEFNQLIFDEIINKIRSAAFLFQVNIKNGKTYDDTALWSVAFPFNKKELNTKQSIFGGSSPKCVVNSAWFNFGLHKVLLVMQIRV